MYKDCSSINKLQNDTAFITHFGVAILVVCRWHR